MPRRTLPKTLRPDEVEALMAQPNLGCFTGLRDRVLMESMYRAGLRVSEACGLHLRDWIRRDRQLHLRAEVTKGEREAYVYVDDVLQDFLERWVAVRRERAARKPHLFTTLHGGPLDRRDVWAMTRRRSRKAGIRSVNPHALRHTFATELLREGFSLREIQVLLRHADLRTTAIYLEIRDEELAAKVRERGRDRVGSAA